MKSSVAIRGYVGTCSGQMKVLPKTWLLEHWPRQVTSWCCNRYEWPILWQVPYFQGFLWIHPNHPKLGMQVDLTVLKHHPKFWEESPRELWVIGPEVWAKCSAIGCIPLCVNLSKGFILQASCLLAKRIWEATVSDQGWSLCFNQQHC